MESQKELLVWNAGNHLQRNDMKDQTDKLQYLESGYTE